MELYELERQRKRINFWKITVTILFIILLSSVIYLVTNTSKALWKEINKNHSSLIFVQVLFRHGNRTPLPHTSYPNDPYKNESYEPYGPGHLTLNGEETAYNLGKFLSEYYLEFLGTFHRDTVYAQSSPSPRCMKTLLLVLAGFSPPHTTNGLYWNPIPYHYNPESSDTIYLYYLNCKKYVTLMDELSRNFIRYKQAKGIAEFVQYVQLHTGKNITSLFDLYMLYDHLKTQEELGYKLPRWTDEIFPEPLLSYAMIHSGLQTRTDTLRKLSGGFILKEMVGAILLKLKKSSQIPHRKIHLYSGHDFTIVSLFGTLGIKLKTVPSYGSFLAVELHRMNIDRYGIKLIYEDYSRALPIVLKLPECDELCPWEQFLELYGKYLANPEEC